MAMVNKVLVNRYEEPEMEETLKAQAEVEGFGTVNRILHTATILHAGWEMDNQAWIVEMSDGSIEAMTTSHGRFCRWTRDEAEEKLAETENSVASIRDALTMWPSRDPNE